MALNEFGLIQTYFNQAAPEGYLGVGDDCALFSVQPGYQLAVSTDTLIEGQHFFSDVNPNTLGHKALAVSLSDLAAMGAKPKACVLALAIPSVQPDWLSAFSQGFLHLAHRANCPLVGGDTTKNPDGVILTVTVFGEVPMALALRRMAAQPNDDIWLTGQLGAPALALHALMYPSSIPDSLLTASRTSLEQPNPPYEFAPHLLGYAHAAIDISDGLLQDLGHVLVASRCGAKLYWDQLPIHTSLSGLSLTQQLDYVLTGGDVFQLCFTASRQHRAYFQQLATQHNIILSRIGTITATSGLQVFNQSGQALSLPQKKGFDHFGSYE